MNKEKLDLSKKQTWSKDRFPEILVELGFVSTLRSKNALQKFTETDVQNATVTSFLKPLAIAFLTDIKPPLFKLKKTSLSLLKSTKK